MSDQTRSQEETYPNGGPITDPNVPKIEETETDTDEEHEPARIRANFERADRQSREAQYAHDTLGSIRDFILVILGYLFLIFLRYLVSPETADAE